ncbi:MAG: hypothetical protein ACRD7E_19210 [Bryobacteraceae bacterium]
MAPAKLFRLRFGKSLDIRGMNRVQSESTFFDKHDKPFHDPNVMNDYSVPVSQVFQTLFESDYHGRRIVGRPLAESKSQKAAYGSVADASPICHAIQPVRPLLSVHAQGDPKERLNIFGPHIIHALVLISEVIEKDAHMQAVIANRLLADAAIGEVLLVLVHLDVAARRWRPSPVRKAQESMNA